MIKVVNKSIKAQAGKAVGNSFDFSMKFNGVDPVIRKVTCLNDLSALRSKFYFKFIKDGSEFSNIEDSDLYGFSSAFHEKVDLQAPAGKYNYFLTSFHSADIDIDLQFELEY